MQKRRNRTTPTAPDLQHHLVLSRKFRARAWAVLLFPYFTTLCRAAVDIAANLSRPLPTAAVIIMLFAAMMEGVTRCQINFNADQGVADVRQVDVVDRMDRSY